MGFFLLMETKDLIKKVRKIEIKTRRLSDHVFGGEYHSAFKGRGMTFNEVRSYQFGDDVRSIDWNVTARYNEPFVKVFEEERELTMMLMIDVSGSEYFGTQSTYKKNILIEIAATLAFSAIQNNDKVGLMLFTDQIELYIPPQKGRMHVLRIIRELIEFKPQNHKTDISFALKSVSNMIKKRAIVFVMSDFMDDNYERSLKIVSKRHDVTGIRIFDEREAELPNVGLVQAKDAESGNLVWINTAFKSTRKRYRKQYLKRVEYFDKSFKLSGAGRISTKVEDSYVKKLLSYFKAR